MAITQNGIIHHKWTQRLVDATTVKDVGMFCVEALYKTEKENSSILSQRSPFPESSIMGKGGTPLFQVLLILQIFPLDFLRWRDSSKTPVNRGHASQIHSFTPLPLFSPFSNFLSFYHLFSSGKEKWKVTGSSKSKRSPIIFFIFTQGHQS